MKSQHNAAMRRAKTLKLPKKMPKGPRKTKARVSQLICTSKANINPHAMHGIPSQPTSNIGTTEYSLDILFSLADPCQYSKALPR